jgi:Flp pilus assembly protein TadB
MHNYRMYIVAIAWIYVIAMVALTESSLFAGLFAFIFYGVLPVSLIIWMSGTKVRRQRQRERESAADQPD